MPSRNRHNQSNITSTGRKTFDQISREGQISRRKQRERDDEIRQMIREELDERGYMNVEDMNRDRIESTDFANNQLSEIMPIMQELKWWPDDMFNIKGKGWIMTRTSRLNGTSEVQISSAQVLAIARDVAIRNLGSSWLKSNPNKFEDTDFYAVYDIINRNYGGSIATAMSLELDKKKEAKNGK